MNFKEQMKIEDDAAEAAVETVRICSMKLRGEINRLQEENRDLVRSYAKLNDEYNDLIDQREEFIQSACNKYTEFDNVGSWEDLWQDIIRPLEPLIRTELIKRGCDLGE